MEFDDLVEEIIECGISNNDLVRIIRRERLKKEMLLEYDGKVSRKIYDVLINHKDSWSLCLCDSSHIEVLTEGENILSHLLGEGCRLDGGYIYNVSDAEEILDEIVTIDYLVSPVLEFSIRNISMSR